MRRATAILLLIVLAGPVAAQSQAPSREDLSRIEAEQRTREAWRDQQRDDAGTTRQEIAELNAQLAELSEAQARGETSVSEQRLKLAALNVRETDLTARAGANSNQLARLLGALQMYSRSPPPALFVNPRDAKDAVRAAILIRAVTPELHRRATTFAAQEAEARHVRRDAAAQAHGLFTAESDVADRAARIEVLLAEKMALERSLTAGAVIAEGEIAALAARAAALRAVVGALPASKAAPAAALGRLTPPVPGAPTRRFGEAEPGGSRSEGWVWRPASGASVSAPAAGIVEYAGPVDGWGNVVIVGAAGGHHLVLAGLGPVSARAGQSVAPGQTVGRMAIGADMSLSSELRLEVRKDGRALDPARLMQAR